MSFFSLNDLSTKQIAIMFCFELLYPFLYIILSVYFRTTNNTYHLKLSCIPVGNNSVGLNRGVCVCECHILSPLYTNTYRGPPQINPPPALGDFGSGIWYQVPNTSEQMKRIISHTQVFGLG